MVFVSFLGLLINHLRVEEEIPAQVILQDCSSKALKQEEM